MAIPTATAATPLAPLAPLAEVASSPTAMPSISIVTLTVKALMTTFTPPASCADMHITQLSSPGYELWLNEPQPVPGSRIGDCYPSEYMAGYTSVYNASSSIAPMFSPLVCPQGWDAVKTWTNGYIACCASGFLLHEPNTTIDENRPAYGGTCYSSIQVGQTIKVTAYNSASVTATVDWVASTTTDQVFAHPIDGYQAEVVDNSPSSKLSGGAIAGIVIGSIAGLIAILLAMLFLLRRYRRKKEQTAFDVSQQFPYGNQYGQWNKEYPETPITGNFQSPYDSTGGTFNSSSPSYRTNQRFELGCPEPRELDSGWPGRELESREVSKSLPEIPKHEGG